MGRCLVFPDFFYGTAWKEDRTPALTELALRTGFRGIDTANQRRHYSEVGVGQGLAATYRAGVVSRADLFLQTKFITRVWVKQHGRWRLVANHYSSIVSHQ